MKTTNATLISIILALGTLVSQAQNIVTVSASELIGKVYGIADPNSSEKECRNEIATRLNVTPCTEDDAEWLSSDNGYQISYQGLTPDVEAMARYENGEVAGYGYIFYFPYSSARRETANDNQCNFCSALLQELSDSGMILGADPMTDSLFEVNGIFDGGNLKLTLRENITHNTVTASQPAGSIPFDREGEFVLLISVIPQNTTFTANR